MENETKSDDSDSLDEQPCSSLSKIEETILIIKPHAVKHIQEIEKRLLTEGFCIQSIKKARYRKTLFEQIYPENDTNNFFAQMCTSMSLDVVVVYRLYRVNAIQICLDLIGPSEPALAKKIAPNSLRALYAVDRLRNCCYSSKNEKDVKRDRTFLLGKECIDRCSKRDRIILIIKPFASKKYGDLIRTFFVCNGFSIVTEKICVYTKYVLNDVQIDCEDDCRQHIIDYMVSGHCIVLILEKVMHNIYTCM